VRRLRPSDVLFLKQKMGSGNVICSYNDFVDFTTKWWGPLRRVVAWLGSDWRKTERELLVHGFLNRAATEERLRGKAPGTFLLRFSDSRPGELVLSAVMAASTTTGVASGEVDTTVGMPPPSRTPQPLSLAPLPLERGPNHVQRDGANPQAGDVGHDQASAAAGPSVTVATAGATTATATTPLKVEHCLVVFGAGWCALKRTFEGAQRQDRREYATLAELVLGTPSLQFIEPNVPKARAFRSDTHAGN